MIWHSKQHQTGTKLKPPKRRTKRLRTKSPSPTPPEVTDIEITPKEEEVVAETVYEQVIEEFV
ncbi:hypothetical protein, partial [Klebsiella pneumoniae]|uniref:hypothetical protein n=1 Tax=Klebsiella pneumoniae TaxID=573 RepID=UPI004055728C